MVRVRGLAYGGGPGRTLDVYHRRDRPGARTCCTFMAAAPFRQQGPRGAAADPAPGQPPRFRLRDADYRLQPHVTLAGQVADARGAIAWVRAHAAEFGAEPGTLFVAGSSSGANLAIRAVCDGDRHRGPDLPLRLLRRPRAAR